MNLATWQRKRRHYIHLINQGEDIPMETIIRYELDKYVEEFENRTDRIMREWSSVDFD